MQDHYAAEKKKHFAAAAHHDIRTATQNSPAWLTASATSSMSPYAGGIYWHPVAPDLSADRLCRCHPTTT
jgi:hypothetical protein